MIILNNFVDSGQANLLKSSVLVVGAGGLGSPALLYLAACGVGNIFRYFDVYSMLVIIAATLFFPYSIRVVVMFIFRSIRNCGP